MPLIGPEINAVSRFVSTSEISSALASAVKRDTTADCQAFVGYVIKVFELQDSLRAFGRSSKVLEPRDAHRLIENPCWYA